MRCLGWVTAEINLCFGKKKKKREVQSFDYITLGLRVFFPKAAYMGY